MSGILCCQLESLNVCGKKDAKEKHLREALTAGGFHGIPHAVPLPSAPHVWVEGVDCNSVKMFKFALYPAVLSQGRKGCLQWAFEVNQGRKKYAQGHD